MQGFSSASVTAANHVLELVREGLQFLLVTVPSPLHVLGGAGAGAEGIVGVVVTERVERQN